MKVLVLAGVILYLTYTALGAGVAIHVTIISRIHGLLPLDIQEPEYLPYLLGGAFFPDSFYGCGINQHNTSEHIHWPPFLKSAVEYYRLIQPQAEPDEALRLKAFVYGIFSHQVADSSWHSLRLEQGLLEVIAHMEFNGDYDQAHQFLDTSGDFLQLWKVEDYDFYNTPLKLPKTVHILNLLKKEGLIVSPTELFYCFRRGESALKAEIKVAEVVGPVQAESSPLLNDILDSYYLGGLEEISNSLFKCLSNFDGWFEHGPSKDPWSLCGSIIENSLKVGTEVATLSADGLIISPYISFSHFGQSLAVGYFLNEPSLAVGAPLEEGSGSVYVLALNDFIEQASVKARVLRSSSSGFKYSKKFGDNVVAYNLLGHDFTLISEPGTSKLYLYSENERLLTISNAESPGNYGASGFKQENSVITTHDVNGDGLTDIILGSPYSDVDGRPQSGNVKVLSGDFIAALVLGSKVVQEVDVTILKSLELEIPQHYRLVDGYEQFGTTVAADDQFLYVTANGVSAVFVYSHDGKLKHIIQKDIIDHVEPLRKTSRDSGRFGSNWILAGLQFEDMRYLIIGEHANGSSKRTLLGAVYFYIVGIDGSIKFHTILKPKSTLASAASSFGYAAIVHDENLYISAPGYDNFRGAIYKVSLRDILCSNDKEQYISNVFLIGERGYSGFGESMAAYDKHLIVGEAKFGFGELFDDKRKHMGRVGIYDV